MKTPRLKLSIGHPTVMEDGIAGWARYRIDFVNVDVIDKYAMGWISPRYPTIETMDYLDRIKGWWTGWNREIMQEDAYEIVPFKVKLYRLGLNDELGLLDSAEYEELQPA